MRARHGIDLSTRHLQAVTALARSGKFVAAAAEIGVSQPTLSRLIQQAEEELGVALFHRGTRSVQQTGAGRAFIPAAERMLGELTRQAEALAAPDGQLRGQLVISSLMSIAHHVVPAALVAFRRKHPGIFVQVREGVASGVIADVRSGAADFGIGPAPDKPGEFAVQSITDEPCYLIIPPRHRLAKRASVGLRELDQEPMVSMPTDSGLRRLIDATAQVEGVTLNHSIVTNQFPSLCEFVAKGLGVSIIPASAVSPVFAGALSVRKLRPALKRRVGILHLAERPLSAPSAVFLEIFRPMFLAAIKRG
jgi:LysR family transcriptional regulator, carnitine catabolism transcriptional activator